MLSDEEVLRAVRELTKGRGEEFPAALPGAAEITWYCLLEGEIVRCVESRTEKERFHAGPLDLSGRPVFETTIDAHHVPPPQDPSQEKTFRLVRRGSVDDRSCDCGNGSVACPRCSGAGDLRCEPRTPCTGCKGNDSCLRCDGTGKRSGAPEDRAAREQDERVTCRLCGALGAACGVCRGRGAVECPTCRGAGLRACPDCDRAGTVPHRRCEGKGRTVTWTEGVITRRPDTDKVRLPEFGVPYLARQSAREKGAWVRTDLTDDKPLPDRQAKLLGRELRPKLVKRDQEIARRADLRYLPLARVVVTAQPHRVYYVVPTARAPHVLLLPSRRRSWQIAAVACGALALLFLAVRFIG
ncbi:hypothetical protein ACF08W_25455 [Streptomyces sp. NPDC015144]|uniref:hypothetical protein n=1 Tax=Streptomyces sp. NPDC015144 TaxID=3364944 RepID=UPI003700738F